MELFIPGVGIVQAGSAFRMPDGRLFNGAWLAGADQESLDAIGAVPVNRQARPIVDERTHQVAEVQDGPNITYSVTPLPAEQIDQAVAALAFAAAEAVDAASERTRLLFVTAGSAQAMVYQEKMEEAARWIAAGSPAELEEYPLIAGEIGINGATAQDVVNLWTQMRSVWRQVAAQIENIRLGAKAAINTAAGAGDFASIELARDQALAALALIAP